MREDLTIKHILDNHEIPWDWKALSNGLYQ